MVLIVADDMGYGDFGAFGDGSPRTPTLDHLVSQGLCFTQHYSASCVCAPARAAAMLQALETWFETVDAERRRIPPS